MKSMMLNSYCEKVKYNDIDTINDFAAFLHHVTDCDDCTRRIYSRIIVEFNQKLKEK